MTASQTLGPFGAISFEQTQIADVASPGVGGERVTIRGRVLDADGNPVNDAMVETWQANAHGKYAHPDDAQENRWTTSSRALARAIKPIATVCSLTATIKPGRPPGPGGGARAQAPHLVAVVFQCAVC